MIKCQIFPNQERIFVLQVSVFQDVFKINSGLILRKHMLQFINYRIFGAQFIKGDDR